MVATQFLDHFDWFIHITLINQIYKFRIAERTCSDWHYKAKHSCHHGNLHTVNILCATLNLSSTFVMYTLAFSHIFSV